MRGLIDYRRGVHRCSVGPTSNSVCSKAIDLGQGQIASARALVGSIAPATNDADFDAASISTLSASAELQSSEAFHQASE